MKNKGVYFFGFCRLIGKGILLGGTATRNINSEDHYTCFGSECLCMRVLF
jgi:hypothetical protein